MPTTSQPSLHRKLIDIPEDIFSILSIKAAARGLSLKKFLEAIIVREAQQMEDAELYKYLVATRPEGKIMLSPSEQEEFERKLGIFKGQ